MSGYYSAKEITSNTEFTNETRMKARKILASSHISIVEYGEGYLRQKGSDSNKHIQATGEFTSENGEKHKITVILKHDQITYVKCDAPGCLYKATYDGKKPLRLCEHAVAFLSLLTKELESKNVGDSTTREAMELLQGCRDIRSSQYAELDAEVFGRKRNVKLVPKLIYKGDGIIHMALKIKTPDVKMTQVKDILRLFDCADRYLPLGVMKDGEINFAKSDFNADAKELFEFAKSCYEDDVIYRRLNGINEDEELLESIPLFGSRLDRFYNMRNAKGKVPYADLTSDDKTEHSIRFDFNVPEINLEVKGKQNGDTLEEITLTSTDDIPTLLLGREFKYFIDKTGFHKISQRLKKPIDELSKVAKDGKVNLKVGKKHINEFTNVCLDQLDKVANIKYTNERMLKKSMPPKAQVEFHIDFSSDDELKCQPVVRYGNEMVCSACKTLENNQNADFRDWSTEKNAVKITRQYFPDTFDEGVTFVCRDEELKFDFISKGQDIFREYGAIVMDYEEGDSRIPKVRKKMPLKATLSAAWGTGIINLGIAASDAIDKKEIEKFIESYKQGKKYYKLKNGEVLSLDEHACCQIINLAESTGKSVKKLVNDGAEVPVQSVALLEEFKEQAEAGEFLEYEINDDYKKIAKQIDGIEDIECSFPESVSGMLYKHQKESFRFIKTRFTHGLSAILADDMGLGKTFTVLSLILSEKEENPDVKPCIVIGSTNLVGEWKNEIEKHSIPLKAAAVIGPPEARHEIIENYTDYDVLFTTYESLRNDIEYHKKNSYHILAIDEAQKVNKPDLVTSKAICETKRNHTIAISGTPAPNNTNEWYGIFEHIAPGLLGTPQEFKKSFYTPIQNEGSTEAAAMLHSIVSRFMIKHKKEECLDLPDKHEDIRYLDMEKDQAKAYAMIVQAEIARIERGEIEKSDFLAMLSSARLCCDDPLLVNEDYKGSSVKIEAALDDITNAIEEDEKILVFSSFETAIDRLGEKLNENGIKYYKISGSVTQKERERQLADFREDDTVKVFLMTIGSCAEGLNLQVASKVILLDPWWNVAKENQAISRSYRNGQTKAVHVVHYICRRSVEESILELQKHKDLINKAIMQGEEDLDPNSISLSHEDIMNMYEGDYVSPKKV